MSHFRSPEKQILEDALSPKQRSPLRLSTGAAFGVACVRMEALVSMSECHFSLDEAVATTGL